MSRRGPLDDIERVFDRMNEEFERLGRQMEEGDRRASADVVETDDAVVVRVDLPGYEADEIHLTVDDRLLTVTAEREETDELREEGPSARYHRRERSRRGTSRRLRLPADVRGTEADAAYEHGVLTVTLPKRTSDRGGTRIDVK